MFSLARMHAFVLDAVFWVEIPSNPHCPVWPHRCVTLLSKALRYHIACQGPLHTSPLGVLPVDDSTDLCVCQILSISIFLHVSSGFCTLLNAKKKEGGVELGRGCPDLPHCCRGELCLVSGRQNYYDCWYRIEYLYAAHPLSIRVRPREPGDACGLERADKSLAASCFGHSIS